MTFYFRAHGAGPLADAGDFVAQLRFIQHLLDVSQPVGPINEVGASDGALPLAPTGTRAVLPTTVSRLPRGLIKKTALAGLRFGVRVLLASLAGASGLSGLLALRSLSLSARLLTLALLPLPFLALLTLCLRLLFWTLLALSLLALLQLSRYLFQSFFLFLPLRRKGAKFLF